MVSQIRKTLPNGSVFVDHTLSMEGFVVRDNENVAATDYNYLRAMDELAFQLSLITESQTFHRYGLDIEAITSEQLNKSTSTISINVLQAYLLVNVEIFNPT